MSPSTKKGSYTSKHIETTFTTEELADIISAAFGKMHQLSDKDVRVEFDISSGGLLRGATASCKDETWEEDPS